MGIASAPDFKITPASPICHFGRGSCGTAATRPRGRGLVTEENDEANVSLHRTESECVLALRGALQLEVVGRLHEAALEIAQMPGSVIVDCAQVAHLDASAVQVLLALKLALEGGGGSLRLRGVQKQMESYLTWAGLTAHLPCQDEAPAPPRRKRAPRKRTL